MWHVDQQIAVNSNKNTSYWCAVTLTVMGYNKLKVDMAESIPELTDKNSTGQETWNQSMSTHTEIEPKIHALIHLLRRFSVLENYLLCSSNHIIFDRCHHGICQYKSDIQ